MADKPIALNCPVCGQPLRFLKNDDSTGVSFELYHCPMHGVLLRQEGAHARDAAAALDASPRHCRSTFSSGLLVLAAM